VDISADAYKKLVLAEYSRQRFLIEKAFSPLFDLSGCRSL